MAMLTAVLGPKVSFVSLLCCHRHHVAVCSAALKMALLPPSSWGFYPARAAARVRRGLRPGQHGWCRHQSPAALCSLPRTAGAAAEATRRRARCAVTAAVPVSLAPGLPLPQGSRGCGTARPAAQPRLQLRVPRLWGTTRRHLAKLPPPKLRCPCRVGWRSVTFERQGPAG